MHVLIVYEYYGPYHLARARVTHAPFEEAGHELFPVEILRSADTYRWEDRGNAEQDGIHRINARSAGGDRIAWRDVPRLYRALARLRPDVVFVNGWGTRTALVVHAWCIARRVSRVLISDSQEQDRPRGRFLETLKTMAVQGCAGAFVAGAPQRRYVELLGISGERIVEGCDVVDNAYFAPARDRRRTGGRRLLTVARWVPEKNLVAAGRAFLAFTDRRPAAENWRWNIIGYGPEESRLAALAASSGGRIDLLGYRGYGDLPAAYAEADLYWQPSLSEPWGLAVNEAMSSGLPALVSDRCGCAEDLVTPQTGWTFDPGEEPSMVRALETCAASHPDWPAMGEAAARHIAAWDLGRWAAGALEATAIALGLPRPARAA